MRIICTVTNDLNYDQRMQRIGRSLAGAGHDVFLIGRERRQSQPLVEQPFTQFRLQCRYERGKLFYLEYNLRLFFFLLQQRFDVLCAVDLDTLLPCFLAAKLFRRPLVYDAHEYFTEVPELVRRPGIRRVWSALARLIIPRLRYAYTVGPALAEQLSRRYGIPFEVLRNVPEPLNTLPTIPIPAQKPILLYQGALNEGRGLETALEAMQFLPQVELWLAGEGDCSEALRRRCAELNLGDRVRFLGWIRPAALPSLTQKAWLGLNLLENRGLSYYYSLANKAFDYIQAGRPSLQMDFPEYRRLQEQYEVFLLLDQLSPQAIAHAVECLLADAAWYTRLQENCRKAASVWNWREEEKKLILFYENIRQSVEPKERL